MTRVQAHALYPELAKIEDASIFIEDHGLLTFFITLDYGGSVQGFGGYQLSEHDVKRDRQVGSKPGIDMLFQILRMFNVTKLEDLKGRSVYALKTRDGYGGQIMGLRLPKFDGGAEFLVQEWQQDWEDYFEDSKREHEQK